VAPIIDEPVSVDADDDQSLLDTLYDNSGLIVLGVAGIVILGGGLVLALLRRAG
jgi:hypothetical protein